MTQAQAQQQAEQAEQQAPGMSDYYMDSVESPIDVDAAFNQAPMHGVRDDQGVPLQADLEEPMGLGSLDGTSLGGSEGLGSFAREVGFDAYEEGVDEAIAHADPNRNN